MDKVDSLIKDKVVRSCGNCGRFFFYNQAKFFEEKKSENYCSKYCFEFKNNSFFTVNKKAQIKEELSKIIELAWSDDVSFDAIKNQYGLVESEVIKVMRANLKRSSFKLWRKRVNLIANQSILL